MNLHTTLVTFFFDIDRQKWSAFPRSADQYIEAFEILLKYDNPMIVFVDDRYFEKIHYLIAASEFSDNKTAVPINARWLEKNIWAWRKLEKEKEIMESEAYKKIVKRRIEQHYPENIDPRYTILTHSKIDFVDYAINSQLVQTEYVAWIDFGYFSNKNTEDFLPNGPLKLDRINLEKINLCLINPLEQQDKDILYTLQNAPEKIGAYFFWSPKNKIKEFQNLCHKWLNYFQSINIADDEQHLWIQCYFENSNLFELHEFGRWHQALKVFS